MRYAIFLIALIVMSATAVSADQPYLFLIEDEAPTTDVLLSVQLATELNDAIGSDDSSNTDTATGDTVNPIQVGSAMLFSEFDHGSDARELNIAIYNGEVRVFGDTGSAAYDALVSILRDREAESFFVDDSFFDVGDLYDMFEHEPSRCYDSDDGPDRETAGFVISGGPSSATSSMLHGFEDRCSGGSYTEYYCGEGSFSSVRSLGGSCSECADARSCAPEDTEPACEPGSCPDRDHVLGDPDAPVRMIEYSGFAEPYTQRYHRDTFPSIERTFIDTGLVRYEYRHFPLSIHANGRISAIAAECAGEQERFWAYAEALFETSADWTGLDDPDMHFSDLAARIGLNERAWGACYDAGSYGDVIEYEFEAARDRGISGSPTFLINGERVSGAQSFSNFESEIRDALEPSDPVEVCESFDCLEGVMTRGVWSGENRMIVFVDLASEHYRNWYSDTYPSIDRAYFTPEADVKMHVVQRPYETLHGAVSETAAMALICAQRTGSDPWPLHDTIISLFEDGSVSGSDIYDVAGRYGSPVVNCMRDAGELLEAHIAYANAQSVSGVPYTILVSPDGERALIAGSRSFDTFETAFDSTFDLGTEEPVDERCESGTELTRSCSNGQRVVTAWCIDGVYERTGYGCPDDASQEPPIEPRACDGCARGDRCLPYGSRIANGNEYCSLQGSFDDTKANGASCSNDYECATNTCASGACIDLAGEVEETRGGLERVMNFLTRIFGFGG